MDITLLALYTKLLIIEVLPLFSYLSCCVFCTEHESIKHLFFDCVVARNIWADIASMFNIVVVDFESLARHWINHKTMAVFNLVSAAALLGL
ncbi:hypothetical protein BRADI_3g30775v3 [Brachypodium distachyon]|uniref:Reverse transcriptase zinc-binding domain-containing protein n=1 Tax=Brachypodium distachyon TaxID=15368 RepID=A0A2K2D0A9_BRADI|nr:hypothetical protein BRADI_3g30775v3 [Brachypodium distachyon]